MSTLKTWANSKRGRIALLARSLDLPPSYMHRIVKGAKPVPLAKAALIEQFTDGEVTRRDLFPNDWQKIWPELEANTPNSGINT